MATEIATTEQPSAEQREQLLAFVADPETYAVVGRVVGEMIIEPQPPQRVKLSLSDGVRRSLMIERYEADEVESPPLPVTATLGLEATAE
jgi:hypothetical protein